MYLAVKDPRATPATVQSRKMPAVTLHCGWLGQQPRFWLLAVILAVEFSVFRFLPHPWHYSLDWKGPTILFGAAFVLLSRRTFMEWRPETTRIDLRFVALHLVALTLMAATEFALLRAGGSGLSTERLLVWARYVAFLLVIASLAAALFSISNLWRRLRQLQSAFAYAALITLVIFSCRPFLLATWETHGSRLGYAMQSAAFAGVKGLLSLFYSGVVADPATLALGTARFQVQVGAPCSGVEGLVLMLTLTIGWLIFARRELRLQRAVLLIPVSLVAIWLLNLVRIAALIAIGDAGHADVAIRGFHSLAGWLMFNAVALGFLLAANHVRWLRKADFVSAGAGPTEVAQRNVAAVYLLPFLTVLTASLIGRAASSGFDWLYPLRLAVAVVTLWIFRAEYRRLDWRFSWLGPLAGAAIFAMWLGLSRWHGNTVDELGMQLARLAPWQRIGWITTRALAAVVTVPIVEELAFRGYIARRVMSADVEAVPFSRLSVLAIAVSAVVFGVLHGNMWVAGTIAGVVFALVAKLRGRLGEAVAAHATANLLIAAWVLARGDYRMW